MAVLRGGYKTFAAFDRTVSKQLSSYFLSYQRRRFSISKTMTDKEQKTYHKKASGNALATVRKHSKDHELKLFGSCFW
jgi:hypothetical protein